MNDIEKRLKQIDVENFVWIIYFFIICLCLISNKYEKRYFCFNDQKSKGSYRKLTIIIFIISVIIYIYFFYDNYKDVRVLKTTNKKTIRLSNLSLLGSTLVLISGLIFLYIAFVDTELDIEIAFN